MKFSIEHISFLSGIVGILFLPFSLSLTQFFLYLASLLLIIHLLRNQNLTIFSPIRKILFSFGALYLWIFFISLIQKISFFQIIQSEFKDGFLILFFLWAFYFANSSFQKQLTKTIGLVIFVFFVIGWMSSFLPFRLANLPYHLGHGFEFNSQYREQHFLFSIPFLMDQWDFPEPKPFGIYVPVGFTQTHLSFGALVGMSSLYVVYITLLLFIQKNVKTTSVFLGFSFLYLLIVFFTQARSVVVGLFFLVLLFLVIFFKNLHVFQIQIQIKKLMSTIFFWFIGFIAFFSGITSVLILFSDKGLIEISQNLLHFDRRHTDYQRELLWFLALRVFFENPFGVGAGSFKSAIFEEMLKQISQKPLLWYPFFQTEIVHAHSDFLHFLVISGFVGAASYWLFFFFSLKTSLELFTHQNHEVENNIKDIYFSEMNFRIYLFLPIFLLFSGLFQCYFLDDHTMQFFWILYGTSLGLSQKHNHNKNQEQGEKT
ncbi:MAG: O-antigen ligase family protein [Leptospiraceae bacterium]|nr:O-antigen ligase family protein [Leptospiraceae bacterium]MDW7975424.1 O-antigen ligase family protein [Leptospiraceae bacterium]